MIILLLFTLLLILVSNIPLTLYLKSLKPILIFVLFIFLINIIFKVSIINSILVTLKIFILALYSSVLMFTTTTNDISIGLDNILKPLKIFKINTSIISKSISLALGFIPLIFEQGEKVLKSQASRGLDFHDKNIKNKIKSIVSIIFPMFVLSFKRADAIADSMELKLYDIKSNHKKDKMNISIFDSVVLITHIVLLVAYILKN
jgi:energy-coupling factor transport system permease protein